MPENLVSEALRRALVVRRPATGLIVHADQGSQYTATRCKDLLTHHGTVQSMSRRGDCYDSAQPLRNPSSTNVLIVSGLARPPHSRYHFTVYCTRPPQLGMGCDR